MKMKKHALALGILAAMSAGAHASSQYEFNADGCYEQDHAGGFSESIPYEASECYLGSMQDGVEQEEGTGDKARVIVDHTHEYSERQNPEYGTSGNGLIPNADIPGNTASTEDELYTNMNSLDGDDPSPADYNGDGDVNQADAEDFMADNDLPPGGGESPEHSVLSGVNTGLSMAGAPLSVKDRDSSGDLSVGDVVYSTANEEYSQPEAVLRDVEALFDSVDQVSEVVDLVVETSNSTPEEIVATLLGEEDEDPDPEPEPTGDQHTHQLPVTVTGSVAAADDICSVAVVAGTALEFDFSAASFSAFTGKTPAKTFSITCGADRTQAADVYLSTTPNDPQAGSGSGELTAEFTPGTGDPAFDVQVSLMHDANSDGNGRKLGESTRYGTVAASTQTQFKIYAEIADKEVAAPGGVFSAKDASPQLYVWVK